MNKPHSYTSIIASPLGGIIAASTFVATICVAGLAAIYSAFKKD